MTDNQMLLPSSIQHRVSWSPSDMKNRLRSPLKFPGGKFFLSADILAVCAPAMAVCNTWHEHTAGGANTSLQAERRAGVVQIVADADPLVANVWRVFANEPLALQLCEKLHAIGGTTEREMQGDWEAACKVCDAADSGFWHRGDFESWPDEWRLAFAAAFIVKCRMSRGGMGETFAWTERKRGGRPGEINSWQNFVWLHAPRVIERCRNWLALHGDALTLANPATAPDGGVSNGEAFYYYDPPYVKTTRSVPDVYRVDNFDHVRFIELVRDACAKVAISGYANPLYDNELAAARGWTRHDFAIVNHSGQNKIKAQRTECLYTNF